MAKCPPCGLTNYDKLNVCLLHKELNRVSNPSCERQFNISSDFVSCAVCQAVQKTKGVFHQQPASLQVSIVRQIPRLELKILMPTLRVLQRFKRGWYDLSNCTELPQTKGQGSWWQTALMWCISHFWSFIDTFPWSSLLLWCSFTDLSVIFIGPLGSFIVFHWSSLTFFWSLLILIDFHCFFIALSPIFVGLFLIFHWSSWLFFVIDLSLVLLDFSLVFHRSEFIFIVCQQLTCTAWNHCCAAPQVTWKAAQNSPHSWTASAPCSVVCNFEMLWTWEVWEVVGCKAEADRVDLRLARRSSCHRSHLRNGPCAQFMCGRLGQSLQANCGTFGLFYFLFVATTLCIPLPCLL